MKRRSYHIPIFVPHVGCPHDCVFCNQRHITGQESVPDADEVTRIIKSHLKTINVSNSYRIEVAFFGGSFTAVDLCLQTKLMNAAYEFVKQGKIDCLRCSTRPDSINDEIVQNLKSHAMGCVELGVQSTDSDVLFRSRRGHSFEDVVNASKIIKSHNIELGLQMMIGLPGDTLQKSIKTALDLASLEPNCVRIYPTLVVEDTALHKMAQRGLYKPLSVDEAVLWLSKIIPIFENKGIEIIRVGLQTTEEINKNTVSGPYHPAIKELALCEITKNAIEKYIVTNSVYDIVMVYCNPLAVSQTIGHKGSNKKYFKDKFDVTLEVCPDNSIERNFLKICNKFVDIYDLL